VDYRPKIIAAILGDLGHTRQGRYKPREGNVKLECG
jgi:hypothetical protein